MGILDVPYCPNVECEQEKLKAGEFGDACARI